MTNGHHVEAEKLAESTLSLIRRKPGELYRFEQLGRALKVDRAALDQALVILASWDYKLRVRKSEGVRFTGAPDVLSDIEIGYQLKTKFIGKTVHAYNSVKSTNDLAGQMAESGAGEGTIITAEQQTRGRGRLGRLWHSPVGTGIYISVILRPHFSPELAPGLSIMTALALAETVSAYCPQEVLIKWPNDVQIGRRKLAGILTELSAERGKIGYVIVGVGINVNQGVGHFPDELRDTATSLRRALKRKVSRVEFLQLFLKQFEVEYVKYQQSGLKKAHARVKKYSSLLGRQVTIRSGRQTTSGMAVDIDTTGCLILETEAGRTAIAAGDVTVMKK